VLLATASAGTLVRRETALIAGRETRCGSGVATARRRLARRLGPAARITSETVPELPPEGAAGATRVAARGVAAVAATSARPEVAAAAGTQSVAKQGRTTAQDKPAARVYPFR